MGMHRLPRHVSPMYNHKSLAFLGKSAFLSDHMDVCPAKPSLGLQTQELRALSNLLHAMYEQFVSTMMYQVQTIGKVHSCSVSLSCKGKDLRWRAHALRVYQLHAVSASVWLGDEGQCLHD